MSLVEGVKRIRDLKVQGATSIALYGLKLYVSESSKVSRDFYNRMSKVKEKIVGARPNEPMLRNVLELFHSSIKGEKPVGARKKLRAEFKTFTEQFAADFKKLAVHGAKLVRNGDVIFTHCHSSSVVEILSLARENKDFSVVCTETRPMFQGRRTARDLARAGITTRMVVDSRMLPEIMGCDKVFLGADVLTRAGFLNKVGSFTAAYAAKHFKKALYVCSHTLKHSPTALSIEQRPPSEVWANPPEKLVIKNPAFELVPWRYATAIISEKGVKKYGELF